MARWTEGSELIERRLAEGHLQAVVPNPEGALSLIASAERHVESAALAAPDDPEGAFVLAYDAARKAATSLLIHQGIRPTSRGGHLVVVAAMNAQFPGIAGLKSLDRLRRRRNQAEYPEPESYDPIDRAEVDDAIAVAKSCISGARRLLVDPTLAPF